MTGHARVRGVIAAASQTADGAELLLDIAGPTPDGAAPTDADAALLGVLLALADQAIDEQQREARQ